MGLPLVLLLLLLNSCSMSLFNGYYRNGTDAGHAPISWFQADTGHYLFNTKIDLMKNHFSGLMVVKPVGKDNFRVVFLTQVGLKVFDMEFFPDKDSKVHYIMDAMNKKALIKTLTNDLSLVLMNGFSGKEPIVLYEKDSSDLIYRYINGSRKCYYYVESSFVNPYRVKQTAGITNKVKADLYGTAAKGIDSIKISHYNIRLSISLFRINETLNNAAE
jgi:hypothetical protein